jgi:hypothetical protein
MSPVQHAVDGALSGDPAKRAEGLATAAEKLELAYAWLEGRLAGKTWAAMRSTAGAGVVAAAGACACADTVGAVDSCIAYAYSAAHATTPSTPTAARRCFRRDPFLLRRM